jgi:two-component system chemotaxis sensor kinase CheA
VLVIDDDEVQREFVTSVLSAAGFDASGCAPAVGITNHVIKENIRVAVIDVMMPTIRGDRLAKLLRSRPALSGIGIVLISSLPDEEFAELTADSGADAYVSKANIRTELATAVARAANRWSSP